MPVVRLAPVSHTVAAVLNSSGCTAYLLLLLAALALRLLSLIPPAIDVDEAWFAASGAALNSPGDYLTKALDNKPPGTAWFYAFVDALTGAGNDPRPARLVYLLLTFVSAYFIARTVNLMFRGTQRETAAAAALLFVLISALPSPALLATTTEGLILPLLLFAISTALRAFYQEGIGTFRFSLVGAALGTCLLLKQTALFFMPALSYAIWRLVRSRKISVSQVTGMFTGLIGVLLLAAWSISPSALWYWAIAYPRLVLSNVRAELFFGWWDLLFNGLIFALVLLPVIRACTRGTFRLIPNELRGVFLLWGLGACAAVVIGKGLFFHYFLYLAPLLAVFYALRGPRLGEWKWLMGAYAGVCLIASNPGFGAFWATDLTYYERVGEKITELSGKEERVFVWGGNALPLTLSGRAYATRFVTARFAAPPYATEDTERMFREELRKKPPALFVDLHQRGDQRFNYPVSVYPWLVDFLKRHYVAVTDPALPWAVFHVWRPPRSTLVDRRPGRASLSRIEFESLFHEVYTLLGQPFSHPRKNLPRTLIWCLNEPSRLLALESLLRAWDGLRVLVAGEPTLASDETVRLWYERLRNAILRQSRAMRARDTKPVSLEDDEQLARIGLIWLNRQFEWRERQKPLSLLSRAWWVSYATVKLQPVANTDNQAQHKF